MIARQQQGYRALDARRPAGRVSSPRPSSARSTAIAPRSLWEALPNRPVGEPRSRSSAITGGQTVDTLVAQHLIKTVSASRLMGADCIISGIRPRIAQTIVHPGALELDVGVEGDPWRDAFALALRRQNRMVVDRARPGPAWRK